MASPSSWLGAFVIPSLDAMKIVNNNNITDNNSCPIPISNGVPPKIVEIHLPLVNHNSLDDCSTENHNNSTDNRNPLTNGHLNHNHNSFDTEEKKEMHLPVPNTKHRLSVEEHPARRHRSVDIPFSFPPTAHPDVIAELTSDDIKTHIQYLADHTVQQQQQQEPYRKTGRQEPEVLGRQEPEVPQVETPKDNHTFNMGDNFFSAQTVVNQWIDHSNLSPPDAVRLMTATEKEKTDEETMEKLTKVSDMPFLVRQHLVQVENRLFEMFGDKEKNTININKFLVGLMSTGLRHSDPRLKEMRKNLKKVQERLAASDPQALDVNYETFMGIISDNLEIVVKAFSSSFVIPDFKGFCHHIDEIYTACQANTEGKVASYIPQLARSNPDHWGASICTVDGQRYSLGDVNVPFTVQSCSKPLNYAMALGMKDTDFIHNFVGMEPSGRYFNELCLDYSNKPHNPMINAGAIMTAALIKPDLSAADRFDYVFNSYKRLVAGEYLGFNNAVFLSERECADRNFALAYFMRENKCFPAGTRLHETLDFYFQLCSLEITAESGAILAATLANGGINPLTGDPVLTVEAVRNTLTLMHSCGMYNYSGQFAFKVGLPSKSGVSGCVLVVVPNTMGICLWSPPLDSNGNSCRSVQFCMELVSRFTFHNFDNLRGHISTKTDPRMAKAESKAQILFDLLFSAAAGDLSALRRHSLSGTDMENKDYDGRTALHVAASEGHYCIVEYLLKNCQVNPLPKDRWDRTPLDDARSFGHPRCAAFICESCTKSGLPIPPPPEDDVKPEKD